jgi:sulfatase modifying factor 1
MRRPLLALLAVFGCAPTPEPTPPAPRVDPPPSSVAPRPAAPTPLPGAAAPDVSAAPAEPASGSAAAPGEGACPADMVLVDGSYCEDLEVTCLDGFFAPQNNLTVCRKVKEPTVCRGARRPMRYCIDRYEFPNRKGERPMIMQNFYQAQVHCAGRGKRVCTESEWTKACEGPNDEPFPYGYVRDPTICHGDQTYRFPEKSKVENRDPAELARLWQGKVSGSQPGCVSDYGVHDMPGNADELAASETKGGPRSDFANVTTGGPWYFGTRNMCRPKIYTHDESFAYYYLSWRCCAEADGKPTDPRAPKQIARGWTFDRVRQIASNSWKLPFNPRVPGDPGYAPAGPDRPPLAP